MPNYEHENKTDLLYRGHGVGINDTLIGKCSICGGDVTVPKIHYSVIDPKPTCKKCGAVKANDMPVIKMEQSK